MDNCRRIALLILLVGLGSPVRTEAGQLPAVSALDQLPGTPSISALVSESSIFDSPAEPVVFEPAVQPPSSLASALQTTPHPAPHHTGFKALVFETGSDFKAFPLRRSTWMILAIGGATAALVHPADAEVNERMVGSNAVKNIFAPGKYIGSVPVQAGVAAGLYFFGRMNKGPGGNRTNKVSHLGFDMMRALIVSQAFTQGIKIAVRRDRPTGECCAFPSGHASASFATAAVLERHLGYRSAWPTLLIAGYVGASRLHDNRHFLSDVAFGSALGIATGWTVVGRHGRTEYALLPAPTHGGMAVTVVKRDRTHS